MAVTASTNWEVRTTGSDLNGGGFDPTVAGAGTDFSQQDSAQVSVTDAVTTSGSTTITSATANFTSAHVGNVIRISGGTGSQAALHKVVTVVNSATSITVNSSTGIVTGTGVTMALGGALGTFGYAGQHTQSSNIVFGKSGTYVISSTPAANDSGSFVLWVGYDTTRTIDNMDTVFPVLRAGANSIRLYNYAGGASVIRNFEFNGQRGAGRTGVTGIHGSGFNRHIERCRFIDLAGVPAQGEFNNNPASVHLCYFRNNTGVQEQGSPHRCVFEAYTVNAVSGGASECIAFNCTATPFAIMNRAFNCISVNNTGASTHGFSMRPSGVAINCISYGNGGRGFEGANAHIIHCGYGANGSSNNVRVDRNPLSLSVSPFVNAGTGDFRLSTGAAATAGYEEWLGLVPLDADSRIGAYSPATGGGPVVRSLNFSGGFTL